MSLAKPRIFEFEDKQYEVRVWREGEFTVVQCFHDGEPASRKYGVSDEVRSDLHVYTGGSAIEALMNSAVGDIINARA